MVEFPYDFPMFNTRLTRFSIKSVPFPCYFCDDVDVNVVRTLAALCSGWRFSLYPLAFGSSNILAHLKPYCVPRLLNSLIRLERFVLIFSITFKVFLFWTRKWRRCSWTQINENTFELCACKDVFYYDSWFTSTCFSEIKGVWALYIGLGAIWETTEL